MGKDVKEKSEVLQGERERVGKRERVEGEVLRSIIRRIRWRKGGKAGEGREGKR